MRWRLLLVAIAALALVMVYGVAVEPRVVLHEQHHEAVLPRLPRELDGSRVAVLSDLQVGMWWANTSMVERAVGRVVEARPDAGLLAGDFLYGRSQDPPAQIREVIALLAPLLDSGIPVYAVLGNHDYATGAADEMAGALRERGVTVLRNQAAPLSPRGGTAAALYVVGLGPADLGHSRPERGLEDVPDGASRIVLMHDPTGFPALPARINAPPQVVFFELRAAARQGPDR